MTNTPELLPDREAFEKWFSEVPLLRSGEGYKFMTAQHAWNVWQAAQSDILARMDAEIESSWGRFRLELKALGLSTSSHIYRAYKESFNRVKQRIGKL